MVGTVWLCVCECVCVNVCACVRGCGWMGMGKQRRGNRRQRPDADGLEGGKEGRREGQGNRLGVSKESSPCSNAPIDFADAQLISWLAFDLLLLLHVQEGNKGTTDHHPIIHPIAHYLHRQRHSYSYIISVHHCRLLQIMPPPL